MRLTEKNEKEIMQYDMTKKERQDDSFDKMFEKEFGYELEAMTRFAKCKYRNLKGNRRRY